MNSRNNRMADSEPVRGSTRLGQKRPAMLSLAEPSEGAEDGVSHLMPLPPVHRRAQTTPYPTSPMMPDLDME